MCPMGPEARIQSWITDAELAGHSPICRIRRSLSSDSQTVDEQRESRHDIGTKLITCRDRQPHFLAAPPEREFLVEDTRSTANRPLADDAATDRAAAAGRRHGDDVVALDREEWRLGADRVGDRRTSSSVNHPDWYSVV